MSRQRFDRADSRALRAVAIQFFVNGALFASFVPRLPEIRDRVEISVAGVGALLSIAGVFGLLGSAVVGHSISRFGTRSVMIGAGGLLAMSLAVVGLATTPVVLLVGLAAMMALDVMVDVAMNMQGSWLSARRHAPGDEPAPRPVEPGCPSRGSSLFASCCCRSLANRAFVGRGHGSAGFARICRSRTPSS